MMTEEGRHASDADQLALKRAEASVAGAGDGLVPERHLNRCFPLPPPYDLGS